MIFHKQVTKNIKKQHPLVVPIPPHGLNPYLLANHSLHWPLAFTAWCSDDTLGVQQMR